MRKVFVLLAIAASLGACATSGSSNQQVASNSANTETVTPDETSEAAPKQRCRRDSSTGSRLGSRRVCD